MTTIGEAVTRLAIQKAGAESRLNDMLMVYVYPSDKRLAFRSIGRISTEDLERLTISVTISIDDEKNTVISRDTDIKPKTIAVFTEDSDHVWLRHGTSDEWTEDEFVPVEDITSSEFVLSDRISNFRKFTFFSKRH